MVAPNNLIALLSLSVLSSAAPLAVPTGVVNVDPDYAQKLKNALTPHIPMPLGWKPPAAAPAAKRTTPGDPLDSDLEAAKKAAEGYSADLVYALTHHGQAPPAAAKEKRGDAAPAVDLDPEEAERLKNALTPHIPIPIGFKPPVAERTPSVPATQ